MNSSSWNSKSIVIISSISFPQHLHWRSWYTWVHTQYLHTPFFIRTPNLLFHTSPSLPFVMCFFQKYPPSWHSIATIVNSVSSNNQTTNSYTPWSHHLSTLTPLTMCWWWNPLWIEDTIVLLHPFIVQKPTLIVDVSKSCRVDWTSWHIISLILSPSSACSTEHYCLLKQHHQSTQ